MKSDGFVEHGAADGLAVPRIEDIEGIAVADGGSGEVAWQGQHKSESRLHRDAQPSAGSGEGEGFVEPIQGEGRTCEPREGQAQVMACEEIQGDSEVARSVIVDAAQGQAFAQHGLPGQFQWRLGVDH